MCSCALYDAGTITTETKQTPRGHTDFILPMADSLLKQASLKPQDLEALVFGQGPGSFTGLRIACGVAQGIAFAVNLPVVPISDLACLAQSAYRLHGIEKAMVAWDARMNQVYWGCYELQEGLMTLVGEEQVISPEKIPLMQGQWTAIGSGWQQYATELAHLQPDETIAGLYPLAQDMFDLALLQLQQNNTLNASQCRPVYLRNKVVKMPKKTA